MRRTEAMQGVRMIKSLRILSRYETHATLVASARLAWIDREFHDSCLANASEISP